MDYITEQSSLDGAHYLKLYPQLAHQFKSRTAALIIAHCEYWFSHEKFRHGFYKFLEPAQHRLYKAGDSWSEKLGKGRITFNKIFDRIGIRYRSKSEFLAAQNRGDPFQGKLYLSYYDRKCNQMFYKRNHAYADQFLKNLFKRTPSAEVKKHVDTPTTESSPLPTDRSSSTQIHYDLATQKRTQAQNNNSDQNTKHDYSRNDNSYRSLYIDKQINTNNSSSKQNAKTKPEPLPQASSDPQTLTRGEDMHKIWLEEVGHCNVSHISPSLAQRMASFLKSCLGCCLKAWRAYCRKIASSKFLMGEVKAFKAWLSWVINPATFDKIQAGEYTLGDRELKQTAGQQQDHEAQAQANVASQPTEDDQTFHKHLLAQAGAITYNNWLKTLNIKHREEQTVYLQTASSFYAQYIENAHASIVINALQTLFPQVKSFKCQS